MTTQTAGHTPGRDPMDVGAHWEYVEPDNWHGTAALVRNEHGEPIAQIPLSGWGKRKGRKIGALLAASPALLAACRRCIAALAANGAPNCEAAKEARAAIADATENKP